MCDGLEDELVCISFHASVNAYVFAAFSEPRVMCFFTRNTRQTEGDWPDVRVTVMSAVSAAPVLHTTLQPLTFVRYEGLCKLQVGVV